MAIVTKIKWVILCVITLSVASIIIHLSLAKFWTVGILQYGRMTSLPETFASNLGRQVILDVYTICVESFCILFFALIFYFLALFDWDHIGYKE